MQDERRAAVVAAFASIYFVWGSTFLAIAWAVDSIPPFAMMALRCLLGGSLLLLIGWLRDRHAPWPTGRQWGGAVIVGACFFVGCHGLLAWLEQDVPSGMAALCLATIPLFVPLLAWLLTGSGPPSARTAAALVAGFVGVALLVAAQGAGGGLSARDAALLLLSAFFWAAGTVVSRIVPMPSHPATTAASPLLVGAAMLAVVAATLGEWGDLAVGDVEARSVAGLMYLVLMGTVVTFGAYMWLLERVPPTRVATYAFVNPPVAVFLGWALAGETITAGAIAATVVIVLAVAVAVSGRG